MTVLQDPDVFGDNISDLSVSGTYVTERVGVYGLHQCFYFLSIYFFWYLSARQMIFIILAYEGGCEKVRVISI
jgi:hypothetical protein